MSFLKGVKEVFSRPYYLSVALSVMLLFYMLNVILSDFSELRQIADNYDSLLSLKITFLYFLGYFGTISIYSAISVSILSFLFGTYLSMAIYKTSQLRSAGNSSIFGTIGLFLGFFAPGCFACGIGFASVIGLSGFLLALPFKGLEVFILSFALLLYANFLIAKKISQNSCTLKMVKLKPTKPLLNNKISKSHGK